MEKSVPSTTIDRVSHDFCDSQANIQTATRHPLAVHRCACFAYRKPKADPFALPELERHTAFCRSPTPYRIRLRQVNVEASVAPCKRTTAVLR
jgi:hypothetical protein